MKHLFILLFTIIIISGCSDSRIVPTPMEQERPTFQQMFAPKDSAFAYDRNSSITMCFNEPMNPNTFPGNFYLWEDEEKTTAIAGTFTANENEVTFTSNNPLLKAHQYFTELRARVQDVNGNGIDKDTLFVMGSEFFTSGDYSENGSPEFFICNGSDDILVRSFIEDDFLTADTAMLLEDFGRQLEMAFTTDGEKLIMSDYNTSNSGIYIINPETYQIEKKLTQNPTGFDDVKKSAEIVVSESNAYVVNQSLNIISVVDLSTETITKAIELPNVPKGMAISPDYTTIYVGSGKDNQIWVINTADNTVEDTLTVEGLFISARLAVSPDNEYLIVREYQSTNLFFIQTATKNITQVLDLGYEAKSGNNNDLTVAGDYVYVSSYTGVLSKIQISTQSIVAEITHVNFQGIDVFPSAEILLATVREEPAKLAVIIPETLKMVRLIPIAGSAPWDVAIRPMF